MGSSGDLIALNPSAFIGNDGQLSDEMPASVTSLKIEDSLISNYGVYNIVEEDSNRHRSNSPPPPPALPDHPSSQEPQVSVNFLGIATSESELLVHRPSSFQWSDDPPDTPPSSSLLPQPQPRDFSGLRSDPQESKSSTWGSLQRRKRRHPPVKSQSSPRVVAGSFGVGSTLPKLGPGSWVFVPSGLRSVIFHGDEDAAVLCGG